MDAGYAWVILFACSCLYMLLSGVTKAFGIMYTELLIAYDVGAGNTAWIGSLQSFLYFCMGPVSNHLAVRFSFRTVVMIGGVVMSVGYLVSAFVPSIEWMFLTLGIISGIGGGLIYSPCTTLVSFYFSKRRAFANGIVLSGSGLGSFTFPYFYRYTIDQLGFQGALFIVSAVLLHICVAGALLRQPHQLSKSKHRLDHEPEVNTKLIEKNETEKKIKHKRKVPVFDFSLLRIPKLAMYVMSLTINIFAFSANFSVFPAHMQSIGLEKHKMAIALSMIGATEIFARSFFGWLADLKIFEKKKLMTCSAIASGTAAMFIPFLRNFPAMIAYGCVVGIFPGAFWSLMAVAMLDCVELDRLTSAMGLLTMFLSLGLVLGQPVMGWIEDATGSWDLSFRIMGICYYISGGILLLEPFIEKIWFYNPDVKESQEQGNGEQVTMLISEKNKTGVPDETSKDIIVSDNNYELNHFDLKKDKYSEKSDLIAPIVKLNDV